MTGYVSDNLYSIRAKEHIRRKLAEDVQAYLAAGGEVVQFDVGVSTDLEELPFTQGGKRAEYLRRAVLSAQRSKSAARRLDQ